jgi:hypothetical protein
MRHLRLHALLGASVLGSVMMAGCHNPQRTCSTCSGKAGTGTQTAGTYMGTVVMHHGTTPAAVPPPPEPVAETSTQAAIPAPAPTTAPLSIPATTPTATETVQSTATPDKPVETHESAKVGYATTGSREVVAKRRSFADITASPCYGHANDYSWLTGELQYVHARNTWRLRYASVDEEDRYGGSVTLQDAGPMGSYKTGQKVRVDGRVVDVESREPSPAYRVNNITLLPTP